MNLELFDFIEDTLSYFERKNPSYVYAQGRILETYSQLYPSENTAVIHLHTRIKSKDSLKEKMIRNHFYLDYKTPQEAIDNLHDLVGITVECRFIRNEHELYRSLFSHFERQKSGYAVCKENENLFLDLSQPQPQLQRNGFTIYRLDGYYLFNEEKINYELQIKSLVHNFWSNIEHEVVYKNPDFVMYDQFNKEMLGAIRDNLDVVDRQLEIMYKEISNQSHQAQIGMDEKGFKTFVARSINELVNRKMKDSLGFATDFKKCSAILAQYIYVRDFVNGEHNQVTMIDYMELLNYLNDSEIDFKQKIEIKRTFIPEDPFIRKMSDYWINEMNHNFLWHIFFCMLFIIRPGNNEEDFMDFIDVIRILIIQPGWFADSFMKMSVEEGDKVRDMLEETLANALIDANTIEIVHEDMMYECMLRFRKKVNALDLLYDSYDELMKQEESIRSSLYHDIYTIFH